LIEGAESVSKLSKIIYPVKLSDVILKLDREEKMVDLINCFREKKRVVKR
jgi:hypothetical protein